MEILFLLVGIGVIAGLVGAGGGDSGSPGLGASGPEPTDEGTPGPDLLSGTPFDDVIYGRGGNDTINGDIGNDYLDGNADHDEVYGDVGDDTVLGGDGNDTLGGGTGRDFLRGGAGNDTLRGGADNDTLEGALNADFLQGDGGNDVLRGGPGADYLTGNLGNDSMEGGPGDDTLIGIDGAYTSVPTTDADGADTLEGWEGADLIVLGNGDHAWGEFATANADGASDIFVSGTWITGAVPVVHDYDPGADQLVLYYDPALNPAPVVTIDTSSAGGVTTHLIRLDGVALMEIDAGTATYTINPATDIELRT